MSVVDPVFAPLLTGKKFGLWRVKQLKLVEVPQLEWGKFYSGDCYLVFDNSNGEHIFYWLGKKSTTDERTVAAIKAVELDNLFNGMPVQHREIQGYESIRFKKLFSDGIVVLMGGHDAGLKQVQKDGHVARLFQVFGGKTPALSEIEMKWSNMNHGDTFVVDTGSMIFVWAGKSSSGREKLMAAGLASRLRDKMGEEIVHVRDGEEEELHEEELQIWNQFLPLEDKNNVREAIHENDRQIGQNISNDISLYKCSDFTGELEVKLVKKGKLEHKDLDADDAFIVAGGVLGIWVWLGRKSNAAERKAAMGAGQKFIEANGLPSHTKVTKVNMGGEPPEFRSLFVRWE